MAPNFLKLKIYKYLFSVLFFLLFFNLSCKKSEDKNITDFLTLDEKIWIRSLHSPIRYAPDPYYPPFEYFTSTDSLAGIGAEYVKLICSKYGIPIQIVRYPSWSELLLNAEKFNFELSAIAQQTPEREVYWSFTKPYQSARVGIFALNKAKHITNVSDLKDKRVMYVKGYAVEEYLSKSLPGQQLATVPNSEKGLVELMLNRSDYLISDVTTTLFYIREFKLSQISYAGQLPFTYHYSIATRNDMPILHSIMQKGLNSITENERTEIEKKYQIYSPVKFWQDTYFWSIVLALLFIIVLLGYLILIWRKRAREFALAKLKADDANKAKSEFLANMSHEIRTPMNAIIGFTELLNDEVTEPKHKEFLQIISNSGNSLLKLINDILDLSRIESGKLVISYDRLNLPYLVDDVGKLFSIKFSYKGIQYYSKIGANVPQFIIFDESRLRQILINLVGNALKFTVKGEVKLEVDAEFVSEKLICLVIKVSDTGIGIPENKLEQIFDAFEQVENAVKSPYGGTGLGLTITKRLIEALSGTISVTSVLHKGSDFILRFNNIQVVTDEKLTVENEK